MDEDEVSDVNTLNEDMQNPITHTKSKSRQNLQAQGVSETDEKTTPEMEAALHSSYME
jgi:hypothetical protein